MKKILSTLTILLSLGLFINTSYSADERLEEVYCHEIHDGDTIYVVDRFGHKITVQLNGIDAPNIAAPLGIEAKQFTSDLILNKTLKIRIVDIDPRKRQVAIVYVNETETLQEHIIKNGFASVFPEYCKDEILCPKLYKLESKAAEQKLGVWALDEYIRPWDFRELHNLTDEEIMKQERKQPTFYNKLTNYFKSLF